MVFSPLEVSTIDLKIIRITDEPIGQWSDDLLVPQGEIGEIVVQGEVVTRSYFQRETSTKLAKIHNADGSIRHRMGDVGYLDEQGRVWFCGRKSHRVVLPSGEPMFSCPVEAIFDTHPAVFRSALVGVKNAAGATIPVVCVELESDARGTDTTALFRELAALAARYPHTRHIAHWLVHPAFPVDIRHNAKIGREKLTVWAASQTLHEVRI